MQNNRQLTPKLLQTEQSGKSVVVPTKKPTFKIAIPELKSQNRNVNNLFGNQGYISPKDSGKGLAYDFGRTPDKNYQINIKQETIESEEKNTVEFVEFLCPSHSDEVNEHPSLTLQKCNRAYEQSLLLFPVQFIPLGIISLPDNETVFKANTDNVFADLQIDELNQNAVLMVQIENSLISCTNLTSENTLPLVRFPGKINIRYHLVPIDPETFNQLFPDKEYCDAVFQAQEVEVDNEYFFDAMQRDVLPDFRARKYRNCVHYPDVAFFNEKLSAENEANKEENKRDDHASQRIFSEEEINVRAHSFYAKSLEMRREFISHYFHGIALAKSPPPIAHPKQLIVAGALSAIAIIALACTGFGLAAIPFAVILATSLLVGYREKRQVEQYRTALQMHPESIPTKPVSDKKEPDTTTQLNRMLRGNFIPKDTNRIVAQMPTFPAGPEAPPAFVHIHYEDASAEDSREVHSAFAMRPSPRFK